MTKAPIVLLHGSGMSSRHWRKLGELLAPTHEVIAPDLLGSGDDAPWPDDAPFDFSMDVDAIVSRIEALGQPAHVVGHSYGGLIAVMVARRIPHLVRSLVAYDPVAFGVLYDANDVGLHDLAKVGNNPLFLDDKAGGGDAWCELFVDYWNGQGAWRAMPQPARAAFLRAGRITFYEVRSLLEDRTPRAAYATIEAPALFMTGEASPAAGQRTVALLAESFPRARAITVAAAGHLGPITHAAIVNAAIAEHVRSA